MDSDRALKTLPDKPEITELAPFTADDESNTTSSQSTLRGCSRVLGAFFILFNVWFVDPEYRCRVIIYFLQGD